jgi:hypothetical protein
MTGGVEFVEHDDLEIKALKKRTWYERISG